jgi:hypothetical protein
MRSLLISVVFLSVAMLLSSSASAGWSCNHGTAGRIQNESVVSFTAPAGWGLDFVLSSGQSTWVHFPITAAVGTSARKVALLFYTGSNNAWIDAVDVWTGRTKIKSFSGLRWSGGPRGEVLDLGGSFPVSSIGISILIKAGVETGSREFELSAACYGD